MEAKTVAMEAKTVAKPITVSVVRANLVEPIEAKTVSKPTKTWSASRIRGSRRGREGQELIHGGQDCDQSY